jgi:hypothetical protein
MKDKLSRIGTGPLLPDRGSFPVAVSAEGVANELGNA